MSTDPRVHHLLADNDMEDRRGRPTRIQSFLRSHHRNDPVRRILILLLCASLVVFYFHALLYHDVGSGLHVMQSNGILDANVTVLSAPLYTRPGLDTSTLPSMATLQPRSLADVVIANAEVTLKKRLDRDERLRQWTLQRHQKKLQHVQKIQLDLQLRREKLYELEQKIKLRQRQYPDGFGGNERLEKEHQHSLEELRLRQIKIKQMESNLQDQQRNLGITANDQHTLIDEDISKVGEGLMGSSISNRTHINGTIHINGTMPRVLRNNSVGKTNPKSSNGPNPNHFLFFWMLILSVRMCTVVLHNRMILALQSTQLSDSEGDDGAAEGGEDGGSGREGGERRGLLGGGMLLGLRQRRAPPQARPSLAARIIDRRFRRFVDALNSQRVANGERPMDVDTLRRLAHGRDFTGNDYDALYNFVDENGPAMASFHAAMGATAAEIGRLPTRTVGETQQQQQGSEDDLLRENSTCPVCLERYAVGEIVRTIPCFHTFHSTCIDPWLAQRAECPVCKHSAIG